MKRKHILLPLLAIHSVVAGFTAQAQDTGNAGVTFTERITNDDLIARRNAELSRTAVQTDAAEKAVMPPAAGTFAETSDFITFGGYSTFVPKTAILNLPERFRQYVVAAPVGELMLFRDFMARNIGWISTMEITPVEASGAEPINPERLDPVLVSDRLVIAVTQGNPTSCVRPATATPLTSN